MARRQAAEAAAARKANPHGGQSRDSSPRARTASRRRRGWRWRVSSGSSSSSGSSGSSSSGSSSRSSSSRSSCRQQRRLKSGRGLHPRRHPSALLELASRRMHSSRQTRTRAARGSGCPRRRLRWRRRRRPRCRRAPPSPPRRRSAGCCNWGSCHLSRPMTCPSAKAAPAVCTWCKRRLLRRTCRRFPPSCRSPTRSLQHQLLLLSHGSTACPAAHFQRLMQPLLAWGCAPPLQPPPGHLLPGGGGPALPALPALPLPAANPCLVHQTLAALNAEVSWLACNVQLSARVVMRQGASEGPACRVS